MWLACERAWLRCGYHQGILRRASHEFRLDVELRKEYYQLLSELWSETTECDGIVAVFLSLWLVCIVFVCLFDTVKRRSMGFDIPSFHKKIVRKAMLIHNNASHTETNTNRHHPHHERFFLIKSIPLHRRNPTPSKQSRKERERREQWSWRRANR